MDDGANADAALRRRLANGERAALADAFDRYAPTLTRFAWALASSSEDAERIVQDTFLTLWQHGGTLRLATDALLPWLLVACRDHARRPGTGDGDTAGTDADDARVGLRWVRDEIDALAPVDRRLCEACLVDGRSYADAAEALGLTVDAAPRGAARSRARLQQAVMHDEH